MKSSLRGLAADRVRDGLFQQFHAATALAIARELGIAQHSQEVLTERELAALATGGTDVTSLVNRACVFPRVEPAERVWIVDALQASGHVGAMTGDGGNHAPGPAPGEPGCGHGT
jgi:P-type Ca2+ transporter type 2C